MLGGADRRTLYICTAPDARSRASAARQRGGRIETIEVDVPGAGTALTRRVGCLIGLRPDVGNAVTMDNRRLTSRNRRVSPTSAWPGHVSRRRDRRAANHFFGIDGITVLSREGAKPNEAHPAASGSLVLASPRRRLGVLSGLGTIGVRTVVRDGPDIDAASSAEVAPPRRSRPALVDDVRSDASTATATANVAACTAAAKTGGAGVMKAKLTLPCELVVPGSCYRHSRRSSWRRRSRGRTRRRQQWR